MAVAKTVPSKFKGTEFKDIVGELRQDAPLSGKGMKALHDELQAIRRTGTDVTLKGYLDNVWPGTSPDSFYKALDIDLSVMNVNKMIETSEMSRWLFPEIFRDAIRRGLNYAPFYQNLVAVAERIESTGITMPAIDYSGDANVRMRDSSEAATITEGTVTWSEKQVSIKKKARGIRQSYESIMFIPIRLTTVFFEDMGSRMGADLDADLINVLINGDQADSSEAAPVIGTASGAGIVYKDLVRVWVRMQRLGRPSTAMVMSEANALDVLDLDAFKNKWPSPGASESPTNLRWRTPLPSTQDIYVHANVPAANIIFVDTTKAVAQLTAMPLLIESDRLVNRQVVGDFASIITGFANIFTDARIVMATNTNLTTNPGPSLPV